MRAKDKDRALSLLGRAFPNLSQADGLRPFWNPYALSDWARDPARTEEQRDCVRFLLTVWDPDVSSTVRSTPSIPWPPSRGGTPPSGPSSRPGPPTRGGRSSDAALHGPRFDHALSPKRDRSR